MFKILYPTENKIVRCYAQKKASKVMWVLVDQIILEIFHISRICISSNMVRALTCHL
jgi:hypothetical protein